MQRILINMMYRNMRLIIKLVIIEVIVLKNHNICNNEFVFNIFIYIFLILMYLYFNFNFYFTF